MRLEIGVLSPKARSIPAWGGSPDLIYKLSRVSEALKARNIPAQGGGCPAAGTLG
jgi:hypothetical protein